MKIMKYYVREFTKREAINRFGKIGYVAYRAYVKTSDIDKYNFGLHNRFQEIKRPAILIHAATDKIIEVKVGE